MNDERHLGRITIGADGVTADDVRDMLDGMRNRETSAMALHRSMEASGSLPRHTRLEYRCRQGGCLLVRVFDTPAGPAIYKPAFRYSPGRNTGTHPNARERLTTDGDRRWQESADLLDIDPPSGLGVELWTNCDHLLDHPLPSERINADLAGDTRVIMLPR